MNIEIQKGVISMDFEPNYAVIEITKACNLRCVHCGSGCTDVTGKELTIDEWQNVICQLADLGITRIAISGGEPTLKKGIEKLFPQINILGMKYGIITNGYNMPQEIIDSLARDKPFAIGFSIDGSVKTHNRIRQNERSWWNCVDSMQRIKDAGISTSVVTTLNKWNQPELEKIMSLIVARKADCWQLQLTFPTGRAKGRNNFLISEEMFFHSFEKISDFRKRYPKIRIDATDCFAFANKGEIRDDPFYGCTAGITSLAIDAMGNVMPCLSMRSALCGNVRSSPIKKIWEESDKFGFNRNFNLKNVIGKCKDCELLDYCRGGCGTFSLAYNGHFHDAPFCYYRKLFRKERKESDDREKCITAT